MPCRSYGPEDAYNQAAQEANKQKGISTELEGQLCETSSLLLGILLENPNTILSNKQLQIIQKVRANHLVHRIEELTLLQKTLQESIKEKENVLKRQELEKIEIESKHFHPSKQYYEVINNIKNKIQEYKDKLLEIDSALNGYTNNNADIINEILTNRNLGHL